MYFKVSMTNFSIPFDILHKGILCFPTNIIYQDSTLNIGIHPHENVAILPRDPEPYLETQASVMPAAKCT